MASEIVDVEEGCSEAELRDRLSHLGSEKVEEVVAELQSVPVGGAAGSAGGRLLQRSTSKLGWYVGHVEMCGVPLRIVPKESDELRAGERRGLTVSHFLYMLLAVRHRAAGREHGHESALRALDQRNEGAEEPVVVEVLGQLLCDVLESVGRLHLAYMAREEASTTVRGRVLFSKQLLKGRSLACPPVEVRYHELSEDVLENQLIKAACSALLREPQVSAETRLRLQTQAARLRWVSTTRFMSAAVPELTFTRKHHPRLREAICVARMVLEGKFYFGGTHGILLGPTWHIYEEFVRYRLQTQLRNAGGPWHLETKPKYCMGYGQTSWKPDLVVSSGNTPILVGDVKYKHAVRSKDLQQLIAYAAVLGLLNQPADQALEEPPRAFLVIHRAQRQTLRVRTHDQHNVLGIEIIPSTQDEHGKTIKDFTDNVDKACKAVVDNARQIGQ